LLRFCSFRPCRRNGDEVAKMVARSSAGDELQPSLRDIHLFLN
jgi:hypothetical protein